MESVSAASDESLSTSAFVRRCRVDAGLSVDELAAKVAVTAAWLDAFERGKGTEELTYDLLLALIRATQPARPAGWDDGHEHDLHLGERAVTGDAAARPYWARIDEVRAANRSARERA